MIDGVSFTLLIAFVPAPPEFMDALQQVEIDMSLDMASACRLRFGLSQTLIGDWDLLEFDLFRPLVPVQIRVQDGFGPPEALINAFVSNQSVTYADDPGESVLEVTAMDATLLMNLEEKVFPWPNQPDALIASAIFAQYAIIPRVEPTPPVLVEPEGTTTQRGTDIRFLRRLAQRNGFDCYVQPEPFSGLDMGFFQRPSVVGIPQAVLSVNMGTETNVSEFRIRYDMTRPTTVIGAVVDPLTKLPQPAIAPVPLDVPMGLEPTVLRVIPPGITLLSDTGLTRTPELQAKAEAISSRSSFSVVAEGIVAADVGVLRPGSIVNIRGAGRVFNGSYYVFRVTHTLSEEGYVQKFQARRNAVEMTGAELFIPI